MIQPSLPRNFAHALLEAAREDPGRIAVASTDARWSYEALVDRSLGIARALVVAGVSPGDRVAIFLTRGAEACASFFGVLAAGAVAVFINESLKPRQIDHILDHSGAVVLLTSSDTMGRLARSPSVQVALLDVAEIGGGGMDDPKVRTGADVAQIIYTSGSTGLPKGVTLSHANLWAGMLAVVGYLGITADDRSQASSHSVSTMD